MTRLPTPDFSRLAPIAGSHLLVIGGCGGIGFRLVEAARSLDLDVTLMDLPEAGRRRGLSDVLDIDLRSESSIDRAFATLAESGARFDGVAICSGYTRGHEPITSMDTEIYDDVLAGNLRGPVLALRAAVPLLHSRASIVILSTGIAAIGAAGYAGYGAAKAGLNATIRILAAELAPDIRVNGIAPGGVDTAFIRGGFSEGAAETGAPARFDADAYVARTPLGRMGVADDIVGPLLFMLSDAARYITGQVLHVNGGALMRD